MTMKSGHFQVSRQFSGKQPIWWLTMILINLDFQENVAHFFGKQTSFFSDHLCQRDATKKKKHINFLGGGLTNPFQIWVHLSPSIFRAKTHPTNTLPKTNIAPARKPSQEETHLPTPVFQVLCLFQGGHLKPPANFLFSSGDLQISHSFSWKSMGNLRGPHHQCHVYPPGNSRPFVQSLWSPPGSLNNPFIIRPEIFFLGFWNMALGEGEVEVVGPWYSCDELTHWFETSAIGTVSAATASWPR